MSYNSIQRTTIIILCLFHYKSSFLVAASAGGQNNGWGIHGDRQPSVFGMIGNALSGAFHTKQTNGYRAENHGGVSSSSPYIRLGRLPLSKTSSSHCSNELMLDQWADPKSIRNAVNSDTEAKRSNRRIILSRGKRSQRTIASRVGRRIIPDELDRTKDRNWDSFACLETSLQTAAEPRIDVDAMTSPIIPLSISIDGQTADEFSDPMVVDKLAATGFDMATQENNDWIEWKMHSSTRKLMEEHNNNEMAILEQGEVLVYIGSAKKEGHGSNLPIIRTKSILPLSAHEMAELLMDSSKVQIYNKLSVGRTDVATLGEGTKVVCNLTKPPIAKSNMVSCTLMHARPLTPDHSKFLVVSRAMPGQIEESLKDLPRNDILLGANVLEDRPGGNECVMTAVTHVYSPALPTLLAKKMGVSSAINFVKDIRNSCQSVEN